MAHKRSGKKTIKVDFTGVEAGGGGRLLPEGPTPFEVEEVTEEEGQDSGQPYLKMTLKVADGHEFEGTKAWDNFSLQPQSLWKLRGFMEAAGLETVDGVMNLDPDEFVGLQITGDVVHEVYKGKNKHRISGYSPAEGGDVPDGGDGGDGGDTGADAGQEDPPASTGVRKKSTVNPFKVKQKASFMDGKKKLIGIVTAIDGTSITVKVGNDEYDMDASDAAAA